MSNPFPPQGQQGPVGPSDPHFEQQQQQFGQPQFYQPALSPAPKRARVLPAIAASVVTSLIVGGATGYLAGTVNTAASSQYEVREALEKPAEEDVQDAPEGSVERVAAAVLPAVVSIEVESARGSAEGSGSIISSDGYVLTNHHVIESAASGAARLTVTLNDGSQYPAAFVASDVNTDVGVIKIEGIEGLPVLEFGNSDNLKVGQQVVAVGSPLGLSATVTTGIVSALNRPVRAGQGGGESSLMDGIQTDAAINPGNSGGPLVDMNGRLVGMNSVIASLSTGGLSGQSSGSIGLGFAIPSNFAQRVARQLIDKGEASQPMLGVQVDVYRSGMHGAVIAQVEPGSPAEAAELAPGESIVRLNDRLIDSADGLIAATRSRDFGETVTLEVEGADGRSRSVDVTLSSE
ncbi:trypsin-like peptidase domain-containing protein [Corynebacterium sp. Q4381]|uniref:S1C family serine protease n=1 Tax=Corynebacterium sp. Marseille-Q4381 TaxID=3121597 RepID=UPI002FE56321